MFFVWNYNQYKMNRIVVAEQKPQTIDKKTFFVQLSNAADILSILRSDYFVNFEVQLPKQINNSQLRFFMHSSRLLTKQGDIVLEGSQQSLNKTKTILKNMGMHLTNESQRSATFSKKLPQNRVEPVKQAKLSIGFKSIADEQIDEDDLLKNEKIDLNKASVGGCAEKPRACANCNCGRKQEEQLPSKEELVKSVNEGNPVSGCGKCYLGDSFRCATCPYQGLPAFKPGDKLKLVDDSKVIVETGATVSTNGKVKIQL